MYNLAQNLKIAAQIVENNLQFDEWEYLKNNIWETPLNPNSSVLYYLSNEQSIRIKPFTYYPVKDGYTFHNPDNLSPLQVGKYYRLLSLEELKIMREECNDIEVEYYHKSSNSWEECGTSIEVDYKDYCYRVPKTIPYVDNIYIPLTHSDIPVGSVIRNITDTHQTESLIISKSLYSIKCDYGVLIYKDLMADQWEILYPGHTEWMKCKKKNNE